MPSYCAARPYRTCHPSALSTRGLFGISRGQPCFYSPDPSLTCWNQGCYPEGMTWLEMANLLFDNSKALSPRGAHVHLDTAGWLRTWTPHQHYAADAAARYFARHLEWPPMEAEPAWQLYFRCLFAIERCFDAEAQGPKSPSSPEARQAALEVLLVHTWNLEGIEWAERRYAPPGLKIPRVSYSHV